MGIPAYRPLRLPLCLLLSLELRSLGCLRFRSVWDQSRTHFVWGNYPVAVLVVREPVCVKEACASESSVINLVTSRPEATEINLYQI